MLPETIMKQEDKENLQEMVHFLDEMTQTEQMGMLSFLRGVELGKLLAGGQAPQC